MNRKLHLKLTALALLLAGGASNVWGEESTTTTTYRKQVNVDLNLKTESSAGWGFCVQHNDTCTLTYNDTTGVLTYYYYEGGTQGNGAIIYDLSSSMDVTVYDSIYIELSQASEQVFTLSLGDDNYYSDPEFTKHTCTADSTKYAFSIQSYIENYSDTSYTHSEQYVDFTNINNINIRTAWASGNQTIAISAIYFIKNYEIDAKEEYYKEVTYTNGKCTSGSATALDDDSMEISFTSSSDVWSYDLTNIGTHQYEYMVIVPRRPYLHDPQAEPTKYYKLTDGIETASTEISTYGTSNRSVVYNLLDGKIYTTNEEKEVWDSADSTFTAQNFWTELKISASKADTFEISAIYFSDTKPTYRNVWNFPSDEGDYKRECTVADTYGTVCLPYASAVCGAYVYDVVGYGTNDYGNPSELYLQEVNGVLEAGKAYIYKSIYDQINGWAYYEGYVTFLKAGDNSVTSATTGNALVGTLEANGASVDSTYYILFADSVYDETDTTAVYKWGKGTGNTVAQYRAYLDLSVFEKSTDTTEAKANGWISMSLAYDGDDGTTGIKEIVSEEQKESVIEDDAIYNLSGVRVTNPQKGIYIKNGKKYIIK